MTNNLALNNNRILPMEVEDINKVTELAKFVGTLPEVDVPTSHIIHGGMYARTLKIPAGTVVAGALIKVATLVIIQGDVAFFVGDKTIELHGYNVFAASAFRKQACVALSDAYATMIFVSNAKTVEEAEKQFTDEDNQLMSRRQVGVNQITITGE